MKLYEFESDELGVEGKTLIVCLAITLVYVILVAVAAYYTVSGQEVHLEPTPSVSHSNVLEDEVEVIEYYDVPLDEGLQDHIFMLCEWYGVNERIVISMIQRESMYQADVVGDNGRAYGLMQIQPRWHYDRMTRLGVTDLLNPFENVTVGIDFFAELMERGRGVEWALMAYNGGPAYASEMVANGQLSDYASYVMGMAAELCVRESVS